MMQITNKEINSKIFERYELKTENKRQHRLKELRLEFESGQKALADLEQRAANLRNSLLRISSAIQVLEEELAKEGGHENIGEAGSRIREIHKPKQETEVSQAKAALQE